jgi:predicted amidohydrolase
MRVTLRLLVVLAGFTAACAAAQTPTSASSASVSRLRVAVVQFRAGPDLSDNLRRIRQRLAEGAAKGAQVVLFPECAVSSYQAAAIGGLTEDVLLDGERAIAAACAAHRVHAIVGIPHHAGGRLYNSAIVVNPDGRLLVRHYKIHLVGGDTAWKCASGTELSAVFRLGLARASLLICHDSRYPELVRLPVLAGARVVFYLSHESSVARESKLVPYRAQVQARAVENGVFVVHANAPADDMRTGSHGQSRIVAPDGNLIGEASIFGEELLIADLDLTQADGKTAARSLEGEPLSGWWREGLKLVRVIE